MQQGEDPWLPHSLKPKINQTTGCREACCACSEDSEQLLSVEFIFSTSVLFIVEYRQHHCRQGANNLGHSDPWPCKLADHARTC